MHFKDIIADEFRVSVWPKSYERTVYYEIIGIGEGRGIHTAQCAELPFKSGDLFFSRPGDSNTFTVYEPTHFLRLRFTIPYVSKQPLTVLPENWNTWMDRFLTLPNRNNGSLLQIQSDRTLAIQLLQAIVNEYSGDHKLRQQVILQLFTSLILLIWRNSGLIIDSEELSQTEVLREEDLTNYIEQNIYEPKKLTLNAMGTHFHYSAGHMGIVFKKKTGKSLRTFVQDYRYDLIEKRLKYSRLSMKQIASEFGFTDESHLNKFVRSKTGLNPSEIRMDH